MQSRDRVSYRDEYYDEREDLPIRLRRVYGNYQIKIEEAVDTAGNPTGYFFWSINSPVSPLYAAGQAPNKDMALHVVEDILDTYAIRIRITPDTDRHGEGRPVLSR